MSRSTRSDPCWQTECAFSRHLFEAGPSIPILLDLLTLTFAVVDAVGVLDAVHLLDRKDAELLHQRLELGQVGLVLRLSTPVLLSVPNRKETEKRGRREGTDGLLDLCLDALEDADGGGEVVELAGGAHDLLDDLDGRHEVMGKHIGHAPVDLEQVGRGAEELLVSSADRAQRESVS